MELLPSQGGDGLFVRLQRWVLGEIFFWITQGLGMLATRLLADLGDYLCEARNTRPQKENARSYKQRPERNL
jgi:hypothetical protein